MDYKKIYKLFTVLVLTSIIFGCSENKKNNTDNTFYIELVNFKHDSLKKALSEGIFGKVSFYKNEKLEILSLNYITEDYSNMHYFKNADDLVENIEPNTRKIKIEFEGEYKGDSINYSLQKFMYKNKQWVKTSDMGFIKGFTTLVRPENRLKDFTDQIIKNTVEYTYN